VALSWRALSPNGGMATATAEGRHCFYLKATNAAGEGAASNEAGAIAK